MIINDFLDMMTEFVKDVVRDFDYLPARIHFEGEGEIRRVPNVYSMSVPDKETENENVAPYIENRFVIGRPTADGLHFETQIRTTIEIYWREQNEGDRAVVELANWVMAQICAAQTLADKYGVMRYKLMDDEEHLPEMMVYPDNVRPYFGAEIYSHWLLPPIMEDYKGLI